ncbi:MAG TPA: hypothetical protein PJ994_06285 [Tepidiformaceae bacterium]|nr:hypothetical protein [Tepidiformaceae bacterium]
MNRRDEYDRESLRSRVYGEATAGDGRRSLVGALFAVSLFLLLFSLSARQVTQPSNAVVLLESGIAVVTDVERLIDDEGPALRQRAEQSTDQVFLIPGYPLPVAVDRAELFELDDTELIDILLSRSAAVVYDEGIGAFDATGDQSINRFSSQGVLELAVAQISERNHNRATLASTIFAITTAGLGVLFVAISSGWARLRGLGFATAAGALPGILMFLLFSWIASQLGGDDPFMDDLREITRAGIRIPLRNFGIVFAAGAVIAGAGIALGFAESRMSTGAPREPSPAPEPILEEESV